MKGERGNGLVLELIGAAVLAGAYSALARQTPEAERGLTRMRDKHHERVTALCGELTRTALASGSSC